jgi:hypothetical protein
MCFVPIHFVVVVNMVNLLAFSVDSVQYCRHSFAILEASDVFCIVPCCEVFIRLQFV